MLRNTHWLYRHQKTALKQRYQKFLLLDFEATCDKKERPVPQEIIEFPCLSVNGNNITIIDEFHRYVKPLAHPTLSAFCTHLTGIKQEDVESESEFREVLDDFLKWLRIDSSLVDSNEMIFVTCGNWDLKTMLPKQCQFSGLEVPPVMTRWINIKTSFFRVTGYYPRGIVDMFRHLDLKMEGRLHSGIDDCRNIFRIFHYLANRGMIFEETDRL